MANLDSYAEDIFAENINMMVPYYLMASYAYYKQDDPIFSDGFYDNLAKSILERWDDITHWHKEYLNKDALEAGSYLGDYPSIVEGALKSLRASVKACKPQKQANKLAPADTMGAFGGPLFDWGK
jgi:hypothetical protein